MNKEAPARVHFYNDEEKRLKRLRTIKDLIAEQSLHEHPCPLLAKQLVELDVLCRLLQNDIRVLSSAVKSAGHEVP